MAPIRKALPFLDQLFSCMNARLFVFFVGLLYCTVQAAPSPLLYNGHNIQSFDDPSYTGYRIYYLNNAPPAQMRTMESKRDKKYDRNCFFSPVQCMLSYNANANDVIYHPSGRR